MTQRHAERKIRRKHQKAVKWRRAKCEMQCNCLFYVGLSDVPVKLCCRFGPVSYIHLIRGVAPVSAIFSKLRAVSWLVFVLVILVSWFVFG